MTTRTIYAMLTAYLVFLLCLLGAVGAKDRQAEQQYDAHYCDMVRDGHWPDYRKTFDKECK